MLPLPFSLTNLSSFLFIVSSILLVNLHISHRVRAEVNNNQPVINRNNNSDESIPFISARSSPSSSSHWLNIGSLFNSANGVGDDTDSGIVINSMHTSNGNSKNLIKVSNGSQQSNGQRLYNRQHSSRPSSIQHARPLMNDHSSMNGQPNQIANSAQSIILSGQQPSQEFDWQPNSSSWSRNRPMLPSTHSIQSETRQSLEPISSSPLQSISKVSYLPQRQPARDFEPAAAPYATITNQAQPSSSQQSSTWLNSDNQKPSLIRDTSHLADEANKFSNYYQLNDQNLLMADNEQERSSMRQHSQDQILWVQSMRDNHNGYLRSRSNLTANRYRDRIPSEPHQATPDYQSIMPVGGNTLLLDGHMKAKTVDSDDLNFPFNDEPKNDHNDAQENQANAIRRNSKYSSEGSSFTSNNSSTVDLTKKESTKGEERSGRSLRHQAQLNDELDLGEFNDKIEIKRIVSRSNNNMGTPRSSWRLLTSLLQRTIGSFWGRFSSSNTQGGQMQQNIYRAPNLILNGQRHQNHPYPFDHAGSQHLALSIQNLQQQKSIQKQPSHSVNEMTNVFSDQLSEGLVASTINKQQKISQSDSLRQHANKKIIDSAIDLPASERRSDEEFVGRRMKRSPKDEPKRNNRKAKTDYIWTRDYVEANSETDTDSHTSDNDGKTDENSSESSNDDPVAEDLDPSEPQLMFNIDSRKFDDMTAQPVESLEFSDEQHGDQIEESTGNGDEEKDLAEAESSWLKDVADEEPILFYAPKSAFFGHQINSVKRKSKPSITTTLNNHQGSKKQSGLGRRPEPLQMFIDKPSRGDAHQIKTKPLEVAPISIQESKIQNKQTQSIFEKKSPIPPNPLFTKVNTEQSKKDSMMSPMSSSFNVIDLDPSMTRLAHNKLIVARFKPKRNQQDRIEKPLEPRSDVKEKPIADENEGELMHRADFKGRQTSKPENRVQPSSDSGLSGLTAALLGSQTISNNYVNEIINRWTRNPMNITSTTSRPLMSPLSHKLTDSSDQGSTRSIVDGMNGLRLVSELMPFASNLAARLTSANSQRFGNPPLYHSTTSSTTTTTSSTTSKPHLSESKVHIDRSSDTSSYNQTPISYLSVGPIRQINSNKNDKFNFSMININNRERINPSLYPVDHLSYPSSSSLSSTISSKRPNSNRIKMSSTTTRPHLERSTTTTSTSKSPIGQSTSTTSAPPPTTTTTFDPMTKNDLSSDLDDDIGQILRSQHKGVQWEGKQQSSKSPLGWSGKNANSKYSQSVGSNQVSFGNNYLELDEESQNANRYLTIGGDSSSDQATIEQNGHDQTTPFRLSSSIGSSTIDTGSSIANDDEENSMVIMSDNHHQSTKRFDKMPISIDTSFPTTSVTQSIRRNYSSWQHPYHLLQYSSVPMFNEADEMETTPMPSSPSDHYLRRHQEEFVNGSRIRPSSVAKIIATSSSNSRPPLNLISNNDGSEILNRESSDSVSIPAVIRANHKQPTYVNFTHQLKPYKSKPNFMNHSSVLSIPAMNSFEGKLTEFAHELLMDLIGPNYLQNYHGSSNHSMNEHPKLETTTSQTDNSIKAPLRDHTMNHTSASVTQSPEPMDGRNDASDTNIRASIRKNQAKIQAILLSMAQKNKTNHANRDSLAESSSTTSPIESTSYATKETTNESDGETTHFYSPLTSTTVAAFESFAAMNNNRYPSIENIGSSRQKINRPLEGMSFPHHYSTQPTASTTTPSPSTASLSVISTTDLTESTPTSTTLITNVELNTEADQDQDEQEERREKINVTQPPPTQRPSRPIIIRRKPVKHIKPPMKPIRLPSQSKPSWPNRITLVEHTNSNNHEDSEGVSNSEQQNSQKQPNQKRRKKPNKRPATINISDDLRPSGVVINTSSDQQAGSEEPENPIVDKPSRVKLPANMLIARPPIVYNHHKPQRKRPAYVRLPAEAIEFNEYNPLDKHRHKRPTIQRPISIVLPTNNFINKKDQDIRTGPLTIVDPMSDETHNSKTSSLSELPVIDLDPLSNPGDKNRRPLETTIMHDKMVVSYKPGRPLPGGRRPGYNKRPQNIQISTVSDEMMGSFTSPSSINNDTFIQSQINYESGNTTRPQLGSGNGGDTFLVSVEQQATGMNGKVSTRPPHLPITTISLDPSQTHAFVEINTTSSPMMATSFAPTTAPYGASIPHKPIIVINGLFGSHNQSVNPHRLGKPAAPNSSSSSLAGSTLIEAGSMSVVAHATSSNSNRNHSSISNSFGNSTSNFGPDSSQVQDSNQSVSTVESVLGSGVPPFGTPSSGFVSSQNGGGSNGGSHQSSYPTGQIGMPFLGPGSSLNGGNRPGSGSHKRPYRWRVRRRPNGNNGNNSGGGDTTAPQLYRPLSNTIRRIFSLNNLAVVYDNALLVLARFRTLLISLMVMFLPPIALAASVVNAVAGSIN